MKTKPLAILFVIRNTAGLYNYKSILRSLFLRGHKVKVSFERAEENWTHGPYLDHLEEFKKEYPEFEYYFSKPRADHWIHRVRAMLTYRRYLCIPKQSSHYRDRCIAYLPWLLRLGVFLPITKLVLKWGITEKFLLRLENKVPPYEPILEEIRNMNPDVVISSMGNLPMTSADVEYVKAAQSLGIPTIFPVISWDYLTTKGVLPSYLDELLVWNKTQVQEAKEHHHFPEARIHVTGAPYFDDWFETHEPSMTKKEFCLLYGLRADDDIIVYLGSQKNSIKKETDIVRDLRSALDADSDSRIRATQIVVRPHPANTDMSRSLALRDAIMIPEKGCLPDKAASFQLFYDTLFHSRAAIVGINTTAVIESIIVGKPCIAVLTEEYRNKQTDALHFQHLLDADALDQVRSCADIPDILISLMEGKDVRREQRESFITDYIRPLGRDKVAGEIVVDEVERIVADHMARRHSSMAEGTKT